MIRIELRPKPSSFDEKVRLPGENVLALLAGKPLPHKRPGRPIRVTKIVQGHEVSKTIDDFPYWRECLDDLHQAYGGICAYYCFRIEKATHPQVDHFLAKHSADPSLAYEWSNYRLACAAANTCKNAHPDVLDPAEIQNGWFQLDLDTLEVKPAPALAHDVRENVEKSILRLKLSEGDALEVRKHAFDHFRQTRVNLEFLQMDHPFLAQELTRNGIRRPEDLPPLPAQVIETIEPELRAID